MPKTPFASPLSRVTSAGVAAPDAARAVDDDDFGRTCYLRFDLRLPAIAKETAIFWPSEFAAGAAMDVILYLHGKRVDANPPKTIHDYFQRDYGRLREALNASGQNAALLAPTLGDGSEAGRLLDRGGLDKLLAAALAATRENSGAQPASVITLRNFYLAAHSGGGTPMRKLTDGVDDALANLQECWSFDAAYNKPDEAYWPQWAATRSADLGYFYFREKESPPTVKNHVAAIAKAGKRNLIILPAHTQDHFMVPVTHFEERARAGRGLEPKQTATS
jgi:hypothetical protein